MRAKRTSAARDALPDEAFLRLRGTLFFGPAFLVTRNKLTFRDNLQQLLGDASPGARLTAHPSYVSMMIPRTRDGFCK